MAKSSAEFVYIAVERVAVADLITPPDGNHQFGGIDGLANV